ncbi:hypothetical protein ACH5RR_028851 [Cinchona calisaya]|uniref:Leucine-rich repeat-containing N-terminal plant-type domain-containing protein n=1 Tax=Cinchona calisaya TaxID=153742 RepID=A0ABD2YPY8_9GENT
MIAKGSSIFQLNVLLVVTSVIFATNKYTSTISALKIKCIEKEREALLNQKREFKDYNGRFSSWRADDEHKDCCLWQGVGCDNVTGHIIKLDIGGGHDCFSAPVSGRINNSLLKLRHLKYLDLSCNGFIYQLPEFIGSFTKLKYLNLSNNFFDGEIPTHLANLTELETLDLSGRENTLHSRNLGWLCQFHKLRYLDLTNVNLTMATDWLELVHKLPLIEKVSMSECSLPEVANILRSSLMNSSRACLSTLGLSGNSLFIFNIPLVVQLQQQPQRH